MHWNRPGAPSWAESRKAVLPLLERRCSGMPERLISVRLAPGVRVGFGIDLGPAFLHVTASMLEGWGLDAGRVARQAVGNLRERADRLQSEAAVATRFGLTPALLLRAPEGWASSLILTADLLPRWFGFRPRLFLAPGRNMLIGLSGTTDPRLARWLGKTISDALPDALDVPLLAFDGRTLRIVREDVRAGHEAGTTWYRAPERSVT